MKKIKGTIIEYSVGKTESTGEEAKEVGVVMSEKVKRPDKLVGSTYKIKPQNGDAIYMTINDMTLNEGTDDEHVVPYEIFINCKDTNSSHWVSALTRTASAVLRKGGAVKFLAEEWKGIVDPSGGWWEKSRYCKSVVSEMGRILEIHFDSLEAENSKVKINKAVENDKGAYAADEHEAEHEAEFSDYPESATLCNDCGYMSVIVSEGCTRCLNCGNSKCG